MTQHEVDDEEFAGLLMEGVHTGLRKGSEAPMSGPLHRAISDAVFSDDTSWGDACRFAVYGIKYMGYKLVREVDDSPDVLPQPGSVQRTSDS
jgi:hypothetical protein